jgi:Peptidase family C25/FlgD Ig-like domain
MPSSMPTTRGLTLLALLLAFVPAHAQEVRLVSADDHGVTLRIAAPEAVLGPVDREGRAELSARGLRQAHEPGRPLLPFAQALIALPPGATATARVIGGDPEEMREGMKLAIASKPMMQPDVQGLGATPAAEDVPAILDGAWPHAGVEVGEAFTLRRQRIVAVRLMPWRYDAATGQLWSRRSFTVRVDFSGPSAASLALAVVDRHWEPILRNTLLNYEQGRRWRMAASPARERSLFPTQERAGTARAAGTPAFDEDYPEVRVRVDTTGIYALEFDQLSPKGYPDNVPISEVSVHRHEFVEGTSPAYVTIELPIEIVDLNTNGVFDSGDYVQLFVQNWAERSHASLEQRQWGEGERLYVTRLSSRPPLRISARTGWRGATGLTPLTVYPWTQRWERNFAYFREPPDTTVTDRFYWTSFLAYYSRPDTFKFETNHIDTTHTVRFSLLWQGFRNATANVAWAQVKNGSGQFTTIADSLLWFGKDPQFASATLTGSAFSEGNTNTMRIWGKGSSLPPDPATNAGGSIDLDWYEATYWRRTQALRGYLPLNSADAAGTFQVHATGFDGADIRVYDVSDSTAPVRLALDPSHIASGGGGTFTIDFQDSTGAGAPLHYFVVSNPKVIPPERYETVTRRNLAGQVAGDYLLVVPEAFMSAVGPLVALHQAQGMSVVLAPLESVNDEFNGGRPSKYSIKRFVRHAYDHWNTRFLLLVGDGSQDGRHLLNDASLSWVPTPLIRGPVSDVDGSLEIIPSDPWYGWIFDGPEEIAFYATPPIPQIFVGRLPVNTLQEATDVVTKLVGYENLAPDQTWRRRMLLLADDAYSGVTTFGGGGGGNGYCYRDYELRFRQLNQAVQSVIVNDAGLKLSQADVVDLRSYLTTPSLYIVNGPGDTCRTGTTFGNPNAKSILAATFNPELYSRLNAGVLWWNFQGHANQNVLSHEEFWVNTFAQHSAEALLNDNRPFLFSAFSCHANGFAQYNENDPAVGRAIGEELVLTGSNRGAIASWASTGFEVIPASGAYHLNVEMARSMFSNPPHDEVLGNGDRSARVVLGEAIAQTLINYLPSVSPFAFERGVGLTYNLLGDPATRLSIGPAQIMVTANGQPVVDGEPVRLASQGDTLRIEADLVSNVALTSISLEFADGTGTHVLPDTAFTLTPAFPDTASSGLGGRSYHLTYRTSLTNGAFRYTIRTTDRYGVAAKFDIVFEFQTVLEAGGVPIQDDDTVAPDAALTLLVLSPNPLNPATELTLTVDGAPQAFTSAPLRGDVTGRQFVLSWTHAPYAAGRHDVRLSLNGTPAAVHFFQVVGGTRFVNAMAFPNPFEDDLGTRFSFDLQSDASADVLIRVYTAAGHMVYERTESGLLPGYHQLGWDGRDAEGDKLANGVYFYRMVAKTGAATTVYEGRLVKLRKPHRVADTSSTP